MPASTQTGRRIKESDRSGSDSGKCDLDRLPARLPSTDPFLCLSSALIRLLLWSRSSWRSGVRGRASGGSYRSMVVRAKGQGDRFRPELEVFPPGRR
ncbi:hypothetical protein OPV22_007941 [Ensete ventricosum]|uniref:Uncharacterized protein n=1 Tax=Ensete ventricosum TaxID=4639 RepID=A0AAV8R755_ENSVE|nr:hypothetical protein OPV22_007941 [Ensete ventricosum]